MAGSEWAGTLLVFAGSFFGGGTLLLFPELVSRIEAKGLVTVWLAYFLVSLFWALAIVGITGRFRLPLHRLAGAAWGKKGKLLWDLFTLGVVLPVSVLTGGYYGGSLLGSALGHANRMNGLFDRPEITFALLSLGCFLWVAYAKPGWLLQAANWLAPCFLLTLLITGWGKLYIHTYTDWVGAYTFTWWGKAYPATALPGLQWLDALSLMGRGILAGSVISVWGKVLVALVLVCYNATGMLPVLLGELTCGVNWGFGKLAGTVMAGKALEAVFTYFYVHWLTGGWLTGPAELPVTGMLFFLLTLSMGPSLRIAIKAVSGMWRGRPCSGVALIGLLLVTGFLLGKAGLLVLLIVFGVLQGILFCRFAFAK